MAHRIKSFNPLQVGKVMGVLYGLMGLLFAPIFWFIGKNAPGTPGFPGTAFAIALPIVYGLMGFIFSAIGAWLYNLVSGWVGGIEVEIEQTT